MTRGNRWRLGFALGLALATTTATLAGPPRHYVSGDVENPELNGCGKLHAAARREVIREAERVGRLGPVGYFSRAEPSEDTDLLHCDLEIEVLPASASLIGSNTMTIQSKSAALTEFTFRLYNGFTISSAMVDGTTPVTVNTTSISTRVVTLDRTYTMDEVFTLTIDYSGIPSSAGFGSIQFTTHNGTDIAYTLSEPYYSYTWWPVKDGDLFAAGDNSDKFTIDVAVIAPDTMMSASNGVIQSVSPLTLGRSRYQWSMTYPVAPYLVCFSTTNYNQWEETYFPIAGGTMPVLFYIYPENDTPTNRAAWAEVVQMLYTFRDLYGEYPFVDEKYGIYECQFGGGMEHQTFTAQGTFSERVTAHEAAHQWWGDAVTCRTWKDIWLNEGFAAYSEGLWDEHKPGSSGLPALQLRMDTKRYYGSGTVYVQDSELGNVYAIFSSSTTYAKGAWVVHMLRHVLGNDTFFDTIADYRAAFEGSAATTADFQAVCENHYPSGNLDWFFQEWIFGEYAPSYAYGWQSVQVGGQDYLLLSIDQTQSASYQRFTMPIDVDVDGVRHVVFNDNDTEHFVIPIDGPASSVDLDPDNWILLENVTPTAYVPGPPTVIATQPAAGGVLEGADFDTIEVTFHTDVAVDAGDFELVGDGVGVVPLLFQYNATEHRATLTAVPPLAADSYTLTVRDTLTAVDSGQALDGEVTDANDPASLPSGDGVAGGDSVIEFLVQFASCPEDIVAPAGVEQQDLNAVLNRWGDADCLPGGASFPCPEDLAAPAGVEQQDLNAVLNRWGDPDCL